MHWWHHRHATIFRLVRQCMGLMTSQLRNFWASSILSAFMVPKMIHFDQHQSWISLNKDLHLKAYLNFFISPSSIHGCWFNWCKLIGLISLFHHSSKVRRWALDINSFNNFGDWLITSQRVSGRIWNWSANSQKSFKLNCLTVRWMICSMS